MKPVHKIKSKEADQALMKCMSAILGKVVKEFQNETGLSGISTALFLIRYLIEDLSELDPKLTAQYVTALGALFEEANTTNNKETLAQYEKIRSTAAMELIWKAQLHGAESEGEA